MTCINHVQNDILEFYDCLEKMKKLIEVEFIPNPFNKDVIDQLGIEFFLKGKATRFTIGGPRVWQSLGMNTKKSIAFIWVYNDGFEGFHEISSTIYYFKKIEFPNEITKEFLEEDFEKNSKMG